MSEPSPEATIHALEAALRREQKKMALVQDVGRALSGGLDLDQLLVVIMEKITQLMDADRSTLYLVSDDGRELWSKVLQGGEVREIRLNVGEGVAGAVAASGEVLNIADAYTDDRFQPKVDLKSGYRTRNGSDRTHCRIGSWGSTRSTRCAAVSAMRLAPQDGQNPRPRHENATSALSPQPVQHRRAAPRTKITQSR